MPQPLPFAMRPAEPLPFVVYTPESKLKHPVRLAREVGRDLLASRELAWRLMVRDISAQYRQSFLGFGHFLGVCAAHFDGDGVYLRRLFWRQ
jgi:hypothetical protein